MDILEYGKYDYDRRKIIPMHINYLGFPLQAPVDKSRIKHIGNVPDFLTKRGIPVTFVINLEQSLERRKYILEQCQKQQINNLYLLKAFNGREEYKEIKRNLPEFAVITEPDDFDKKRQSLQKIGYESDYGPGQQGCIASHLYLWKLIIQEQLPFAFILEDDVTFHPNFKQLFDHAWRNRPQDGTLFSFSMAHGEDTYCETLSTPTWKKYAQHMAACYIITNKGANQLLEKFSIKFFPHIIPIADDVPYATHETSYKLHYNNNNTFNKKEGRRNCGIVSTPLSNGQDSAILSINSGKSIPIINRYIIGAIVVFVIFLFLLVIYKWIKK